MKPVADSAARAERHRKWSWCRRDNDFCDKTLWRVVAARVSLPLFQIIAFVNRLEEFANECPNRGYVGDFSAEDFAAALGMAAEEAERIYAALAAPGIEWLIEGHVHSFWTRNPDTPDDRTAAERQRRRRRRKDIRAELARQARLGLIGEAERTAVEADLSKRRNEDLDRIERDLAARAGGRLSTESRRDSSPGTSGTGGYPADFAATRNLSTMSRRDSVTVTTRAEQSVTQSAVDNFGAARATGQARDFDALSSTEAGQWLALEGARIVTERMNVPAPRAALLIERWGRDLEGDTALMARIIAGADASGLAGSRFHVAVTDQVSRHLRARLHGASLPLPPVPAARTTPAVVEEPAPAEPALRREGTHG